MVLGISLLRGAFLEQMCVLTWRGQICRQRQLGFFFLAILLVNEGVQVAATVANPTEAEHSETSAAIEGEALSSVRTPAMELDSTLFAQPPDVVNVLAESAGAARKLQQQPTAAPPKVITNEFDYTRTSFSFTFINDIESPLQCQPNDCQPTATGIYAGVTISQVEILIDPDTFNAPAARFRVARDIVDKAGAQAGQCRQGRYDTALHSAVVNSPWSEDGAKTITIDGSMAVKSSFASYVPLTFKMGGIFHLCYSDDGSFQAAHADIVPQRIEVYGVFDDRPECAEDPSCLTTRPYRCFLLRQAYNNIDDAYNGSTSCVVDYSYPGAGFNGLPGKGSWTGAYAATYDSEGQISTLAGRTCGSRAASDFPANFMCNTNGECGTSLDPRFPYITPNASAGHKRLHYPPGRPDLLDPGVFKAYTVAACYCPDFQKCDSYNPDYVQHVGLLHFYVSKVCPNGYEAVACTLDFTGAAPQHRFALRVECPTDACMFGDLNRVKIVQQQASNNLPAWDRMNTCGEAQHGLNSLGVNVLPDSDNPQVERLHGGTRQDYKLWNFKNSSEGMIYDAKTSGFLFMMGPTDHELRSRYSGETFDVCYCDSGCRNKTNWFKVGQLRFAPLQLVSASTNTSTSQDEFIIEYMNKPGTFGFYRPWIDYGVMGLQEGGSLKLVTDPGVNLTDADCVTAKYDRTLVSEDTLNIRNAHTKYRGKTALNRDVNKLIFNDEDLGNTITVIKAGFIAVCYCARPVPDVPGRCANDQWVLANRLTIRGPGPGQSWRFSTHVVFRLEYFGWGLAKDDKVRIIPPTASCSSLNGNPRAAYTVTNIKVGCPHPCSEVGEINDVLNGDIAVSVLSDSTYLCNDQNADCRTNDIKGVKVLNENETELEFEANPTMADGDLITLNENFACAPGETETVCNEERLAVLRGRYNMADRVDNHNSAPNEYISGHAVTLDPTNSKKVTIPVGWPDPKPRFEVKYVSAKRGRWTRHSKAITSQEIMGQKERVDMKICWKYTPAMGTAGPAPQHVAEVGTLTLIDPNPMSECIISLTTLVKKQQDPYAPFILSFKTATAEIGKRYESVEGRTQLRIFFVRTVALKVAFTDGASIESNAGEDEMGEARQYVCGKLFKELWSSSTEAGFPMPRGCYYRTYGNTQELNLLFDKKNGLSPRQHYQIVMNGVAQDEATRDGEYAHIFTMDDADLKPYEAIERGIAKLYRSPLDPAYGSQGVRFFTPDGFYISGSTGSGTEMLELTGGQEMRVTLKGDILGGGISAGAILRIYLWPLTMWDVVNSCTVTCIPFDQVTSPCGAIQDCKGDAIIPNFQQNFLKVVLPASMATCTEYVTHTLVFPELTLPKGGFFSTRLGAQITKPDDTKPHYTESVGDFIYKVPDDGVGVGKLVEFYGDGDQRPFRGDKFNVLYANIVLAATLFAAVQTGDAYMTITLPEGYECVRTPDINGDSPWRAEDNLGVFGSQIPQGTGSPDEGGGTRGWSVNANTCIYSLRQNAVVYAGSSLFVRITAHNPGTALKRIVTTNRWQVNLTSKGYHQYPVTFPSVVFGTTVGNFSDNTAVLGKITEAFIYPENFQYSPGGITISQNWLRIFFRTEQATGVEASIHVKAPRAFSFTPCRARDLLDSTYYATPGQSGGPTKRLPGLVSCTHMTYPYNHASIKLLGALLAETRYAFSLMTINAQEYVEAHREEWLIFTLDQRDYRVDGTEKTCELVPHNAPSLPMASNSTTSSFGVYRAQFNTPAVTNVQVRLYDMNPAALSKILIYPFKVPFDMKAKLRVVAPMGYTWEFADAEFRHLAPFVNVTQSLIVPGTTAHFPGGYPMREGNVALWSEAQYFANETYGFEAFIRLPRRTPTASPNEFLFEMGFEGTSLAERFAASAVPSFIVRSLSNPHVDYVTNVESKTNTFYFQIELVTKVPYLGGIFVQGPAGFEFPDGDCDVQPAPMKRGSTYEVEPLAAVTKKLPLGVRCSYDGGSTSTPKTEIRLGAPPLGIEPGLYRFAIYGKNPKAAMPNLPDSTSPCLMQHCWFFRSLKDLTDMSPRSDLDSPISVPSFEVNIKVVEALLPSITLMQQAATGRDNRPLSYNPLVFAFKLQNTALYQSTIVIRGPLGTVFREDCGEDVEVRPTEVFGTGMALPVGYAEWPQEVLVQSCRGEGPKASIVIIPGIYESLQKEKLYPIRVAVLRNPLSEPKDNRWTFEYNSESSDPFQGFKPWTFVRTSMHTATMGRSTTVTGSAFLSNPVTFTFRPLNTVKGAGMIIQVVAPPNYEIALESTGECSIMMQPISADIAGFGNADPNSAPEPNYIGPPSLIWGAADVRCSVDTATRRTLTANVLATEREITGNRDYQLTIFVRNPSRTMSAADPVNVWRLDTFDSPSNSGALPTFRDSVTLQGFDTYEKAVTWIVKNRDPQTGFEYKNGLTEIPGLFVQFQLPNKLVRGDIIIITSPTGFYFEADTRSYGKCGGFRWEPVTDAALYLPFSDITCVNGTMRIVVNEPKNVPERTMMMFRTNSKNPAKTPHIMLNHWIITHYLGSTGAVMSMEATKSWDIVPQLSEVQVMLVGELKAESSTSTIAIAFRPVSDADELQFRAFLPVGFDFTGATALSSGHEVISTSVESIRVRAAMYSNVPVDIVITQFRLGLVGGATKFDLITKLNNGLQMDEKLNFVGGFRLPGSIDANQPDFKSQYELNADLYPVSSQWGVRMGEEATVEIQFQLTVTAGSGTLMRLRAPPADLRAMDFGITDTTNKIVTAEVISAAAGELVARLTEVIYAKQLHKVSVKVLTPKVPRAEDCLWTIEILDDTALPLNTNDGRTLGYRLVDKLTMQAASARSPPMAEINMELIIGLASTRPDEMMIVAPPGFNFTTNCLVNPGQTDAINPALRSCSQDADVAGRATARLKAVTRLSGTLQYVTLKITTPDSNPSSRSWYIRACNSPCPPMESKAGWLGWGEDPVGVSVRQMLGAGVMFPGIPSIAGQMAFRFTTSEKLEAGGVLRVGYPNSIEINCAGSYLYKVNLEGGVQCTNRIKEGYFDLKLTRPLPPGQQAFAVTSTCPSAVENNFFYIVVRTAAGQVQDAAMSIPGMRIQHGLALAALELIWGTAEPKRSTVVSLGIELLGELPLKDPPIMSELLVDLPDDFTQQVLKSSHVETLSEPLPKRSGGWLDVSNPRRLRLLLDETAVQNLALGKYRFQFPIRVPAAMPKYNVWTITVCGPTTTNTSCSGPTDPRALVSFPLSGFKMGENHPSSINNQQTAGACQVQLPLAWLVLSLLFLLAPRPA